MPLELITHQHLWANRLQTALLIILLFGISGLTGSLLFGELGFWLAAASAVFALLFEPVAAWRLTLQFYGARLINTAEAPVLWQITQTLARKAELPTTPILYYVPSRVINAFAVGSRRHSAIALTDGLLRQLTQREITGVLGHEIAHIANDDLIVMGLADYVSRLTNLFSGAGQLMILLSLPLFLVEGLAVEISPLALVILIFSPHLALLAQLGLSRVREFDADLKSAVITSDPMGLASALVKIEQTQRSWLSILLPGWGNPEPSWLRTHPSTADRIKRLNDYAAAYPSPQWLMDDRLPPTYVVTAYNRAPRWRIGGLWR